MRFTASLAFLASFLAVPSPAIADPPNPLQLDRQIAQSVPAKNKAPSDDQAPPARSDLEGDQAEGAQTFVPKTPESEAEFDRREARAMYATAISLKSRGMLAEALRLQQRAHRADPLAAAPLLAAIEAFEELGRGAEKFRYLARAVAIGAEVNPQTAWQAADWFVQHGEPAEAARLYDYARRAVESNKNSVYVLLSIEAARMHFAAGDLKAAAEPFSRVMHAIENPDQYQLDKRLRTEFAGDLGLRVYGLMAEAHLAAGQPDQAEKAFAKLQSIVEDPPRQKIQAARVAQARGNHTEAAALLEEFFALQVDGGAEPYELYRESLKALQREAEFAPTLDKLLADANSPASVRGFVARLRQEAKQLAEARPLWESVVNEDDWRAEAAGALMETFAVERAVEPLLKLLGEAVAERQSLEGVGAQAEKLASDADLLDKLIVAARTNKSPASDGEFGPLLATALVALDAKRFDDASELFAAALERITSERGPIVLRWGVALMMADRPAAAAEAFRRGIDEKLLPSDNPTFHYYLARALESNKQTDEALAIADKAIALAPEAPRVIGLKPWILYHSKKYIDAAAQYQAFIDRYDERREDDAYRDELKVARLILSNIAVIQKDHPRAEEWLEQVLDEFPDDPGALNDLGYLWADRNVRLHRALGMLQRAVAAEPENAAYRDSLGWAYHRLGRREEALAEILKAVAAGGADGVVLDHLGDAFAALGRKAEAHDAWTKALAALVSQADEAAAQLVRAKLDNAGDGK